LNTSPSSLIKYFKTGDVVPLSIGLFDFNEVKYPKYVVVFSTFDVPLFIVKLSG